MNFFIYWREAWCGKDVYRTMMNEACGKLQLHGRVLDLGSGSNKASYHRFFNKTDSVKIDFLDLCSVSHANSSVAFDFEKDSLPYESQSIDQALMFNLLEHIYNYNHLLQEVVRTLKKDGKIFGAVPFLVGYHPDPHDYFRYTSEALKKIFIENGLNCPQIRILGKGPFISAFSQLELALPRVIKMFLCPLAYFLDNFLFRVRPTLLKEKFALGLFFVATKL
ncbi:MAG: methyltransferase domain-containing protein [Patescibacteria group bacterium]